MLAEIEECIALKIGRTDYPFSKDIYIRIEDQDIYLLVHANLEEYHIHSNEPSWHSSCYRRSLEAYLFFIHVYVQNHGGKVHLDVKYAHKIPSMEALFINAAREKENQEWLDEEEYFLLIYRIRNLIRLYPWIVLSDSLELQVQELNCLLKKRNFFSKVTGNQFLDETALSE